MVRGIAGGLALAKYAAGHLGFSDPPDFTWIARKCMEIFVEWKKRAMGELARFILRDVCARYCKAGKSKSRLND